MTAEPRILPLNDLTAAPTPARPLMWLALAAGLGVAADFYLGPAANRALFGGWWFGGAVALLAASWSIHRRRANLAAALLLATMATIGAAWHDWRWNYAPADDLALFADEEPQPTCVEVVLADRVRISPPADRSPLRALPARTMSEATVRVVSIRDGDQWRSSGGLSRLRVAGVLSDLRQGDRVRVFAQVARPSVPLNPGEFDWAAMERRNGRMSELYCDDPRCVAVTTRQTDWGLQPSLAAVRDWCVGQLSRNVDPREAPLVLATLLGDQERLSDSTKDAFMKTGAIHLFA